MRHCVAFLLAFGVFAQHAGAQPLTAPALHRTRLALARYDLEGDGTLAAIRQLDELLVGPLPEPVRREARFLRAVAASDLLVLGALRGRTGVSARVAEALRVTPDAVPGFLRQELASFGTGFYGEAAADAAAALAFVAGAGFSAFAEARGIRRDVLLLHAAREALTRDALGALVALGTDPCTGDALCPPELEGLEAAARTAANGLAELGAMVRTVEGAIETEDPFASAFRTMLEDDARVVRAQRLHPMPPGAAMASVARGPSAAGAEAFVLVTAREVRFSFLPTLALDESRRLVRVPPAAPVFPEHAAAPVPFVFPDHLDDLAPFTRVARPLEGRTVAVAAEPGVESHVVLRVLLSLRAVGATASSLAGVTPGGSVRFVPLVATGGRRPDARLFVRLGGYDVDGPRLHAEIPREREGDGFRFDVGGLERALLGRSFRTASVRIMGGVAWETVAAAVSRMPCENGVEVLLPH